ncbi:hypothetical protein L3V31_18695 [Vibrio sp. J1-1]|uniref:hypothetical protein n=1 Tax=Vibrio sp. J1-1 TaxID=2912251 RepID=UPI001F25A65A|nr:hypothetical protein [Vibrio sp. J1-1]MCF7483728.1 hypothetical protein [Vibrio sp. J1-1]
MRYLLCTFWLIALSLIPDCMLSAYAHEYDNNQKSSTSDHLAKWTQQSLLTPDFALPQLSLEDDTSSVSHDYSQHHKRDLLALVSCRRTSLHDDLQSLRFEPDYQLLIAFLSPPLISLAQLTTPLPRDTYGKLRNQRLLYHLLGRKEANLLYVFKHGREYLTKEKQRNQESVSTSDMDTLIFT